MAENTVMGNTQKAHSFLKSFRKEGIVNAVAIHPVSSVVTGITRPVSDPALHDFINTHNGVSNLYFMVNEPSPNAPHNKLKKEHVDKIHAVWLDADPQPLPASQSSDEPLEQQKINHFKKEKKRLATFANDLSKSENPPTYIIDSGGGIQAFWVFEKPIKASDANVKYAESLSRGLSVQYDTDKVHNIDRIMRIPFTVNIPTKKKLELGRVKCESSVTYATSKDGTRYEKIKFITPVDAVENDAQDVKYYDMSLLEDKMPKELATKFKATANAKIIDLWTGAIEKPSKSECDFALTKELKIAGFSLDETAQILWCFPYGKNKELTGREISRCYARVESNPFEGLDQSIIDEINQQTNPITAEIEKKIITAGEQPKRLKAIEAASANWKLSGKPMIKQIIDQKTIIVMYGQSNTGKSFTATDMAGHIAAGKDWGQYKVPTKLGVLYVCAEAGMSYGKRIAALKHRLNISQDTPLADFPYEYIAMGVNFLSEQQDIKDVVLLAKLQEEKTGIPVGLIVVDTLATTFSGGNENSSEDMGKFIENMKWIQEHADTAVMVVHHSGKDQAAGARGHSSLRAATDTEFEITSEKQGNFYKRQIKTKKQRDGDSDISVPFALNIHQLGVDDDNDPITTCHVILENDDEFENLTPSKLDGLKPTTLHLYNAINIYKKLSNPDKYRFTAIEKVTIIFDDLVKNKGLLCTNDGTIDSSHWAILAAPNNSQLKLFRTHRTILIEENVLSEIELNQLLMV